MQTIKKLKRTKFTKIDKGIKTKYLFLKTNTTGLPRNWKAPITDTDNWPRMVQLAWILSDNNGNTTESMEFIVKPENYEIPFDAASIHGISTEIALNEGVYLESLLTILNERINEADYLIGHNIEFDLNVIGTELLRKNIVTELFNKKKVCTMMSSVDYCQLSGPLGFKYPSLSQLHYSLFNKPYHITHETLMNLKATEKCFCEMKNKKII